jgi:hypothetical protein
VAHSIIMGRAGGKRVGPRTPGRAPRKRGPKRRKHVQPVPQLQPVREVQIREQMQPVPQLQVQAVAEKIVEVPEVQIRKQMALKVVEKIVEVPEFQIREQVQLTCRSCNCKQQRRLCRRSCY